VRLVSKLLQLNILKDIFATASNTNKMISKAASFIFLLSLISHFLIAQTVTVTGSASLPEGTDYSDIEIEFIQIAPNVSTQILTTNVDGNFSDQIPAGLYDINYKKKGYFTVSLKQVNCFSSKAFDAKTLKVRNSLILIPSDFQLIQDAIDDAQEKDTIVMDQGVYVENIDLKGKKLMLASNFIFSKDTADINRTIIDGNQAGSAVICSTFEMEETILSGFTIRNGKTTGTYPNGMGGGIRCIQSSPTLEYLKIENNSASYGGGGIFLTLSGSKINNVKVMNNSAARDGGGIRITSSDVMLQNVLVVNNSAGDAGGGITINYNSQVSHVKIINSTISGNTVTKTSTETENFFGGSGIKSTGSNLTVENSIIAFNKGDYGISFYDQGLVIGYPMISYSLLWKNDKGDFYGCNPLNGPIIARNINNDSVDAFFDIFSDPQFISKTKNRYLLAKTSDAVDAGYNDFIDLEFDVDGSVRISNDNALEESRVNIGAYEAISDEQPEGEQTEGGQPENVPGLQPQIADYKKVICENEALKISITSLGSKFKWYASASEDSFISETGKSVTFDTLTHSITLYVANADSAILSDFTPLSVSVLKKPAFTIAASAVSPLEYQFFVSSADNIEKYSWSSKGINLSSDQQAPIFEFAQSGLYEICLEASNAACQVDVCQQFNLVIAGLEKPDQLMEYKIYPNPTTDLISISRKDRKSFNVQLQNMSGVNFYSNQNNYTYDISVNHFSDGLYILLIKSEGSEQKMIPVRIVKK
jgi:hypothetical protein